MNKKGIFVVHVHLSVFLKSFCGEDGEGIFFPQKEWNITN